jgi:hypothetical protein
MQAIEFEAHLGNGLMQVPLIYHHWYNKSVKVILLQDELEKTPINSVWDDVLMLQCRLKQKNRTFSDSTQLIREERDQ